MVLRPNYTSRNSIVTLALYVFIFLPWAFSAYLLFGTPTERKVYLPCPHTSPSSSNPVSTRPGVQLHASYNRSNTNQMDSLYDRAAHFDLFDVSLDAKCTAAVYGEVDKLTCSSRTDGRLLQVHPACWDFWTSTPDVLLRMSQINGAGGIFGLVAQGSLMSEVDYVALNFILAANPETSGNIVEFGTASGLTTLYLGVAAKLRGIMLITYDYIDVDCRDERVKTVWLDNMHFKQADILSTRESCPQRGSLQREGGCTPCSASVAEDVASASMLFVDNGEKIHEASMYAKYLNLGSVIVVHDHCGSQFTEPYEYTLKKFGFHAKYGDYFAAMGSCVRAWVRVSFGGANQPEVPPQNEHKLCNDLGWQS